MARFVSHTINALVKTPRKTGVTGGFVRRYCCLASCLLTITASTGLCRAEEEKMAPPKQPMSVVTILSEDNQGNALHFPSAVAFDSEQEEIYVIKGGNKMGFVIYDSDFLPHLFLGAGRGIDTPQSIFFDSKEGNLFVCQGKSATHPPRLTILNGAFFPVKEIIFDHIPEAENFSPFRGALGKTGNIYLVDNNTRGVLVLDKDGNFLRWLRPMDSIRRQVARMPQEKESQAKKETVEVPPPPPSEPPLETDLLDLPPGRSAGESRQEHLPDHRTVGRPEDRSNVEQRADILSDQKDGIAFDEHRHPVPSISSSTFRLSRRTDRLASNLEQRKSVSRRSAPSRSAPSRLVL